MPTDSEYGVLYIMIAFAERDLLRPGLEQLRVVRAARAATAVGLRRLLRANGSREQHVWHGV